MVERLREEGGRHAFTAIEANRQLTHYSYHVGQIVLLAKPTRATDGRA